MKKVLVSFLALGVAALFTACDNSKKEEAQAPAAEQTAPAAAPEATPAPMDKPADAMHNHGAEAPAAAPMDAAPATPAPEAAPATPAEAPATAPEATPAEK